MLRAAIVALLIGQILVAAAYAAPDRTLRIEKVDEAGQPLPGACFQLYVDAGGGTRGEYRNARCDGDDGENDGTITIRNLEPDDYLLEENRPPEGYAKGPDVPVTVAADEEVTTVRVPNRRDGAVPTVPPVETPPTPTPETASPPAGTPEATPGRVDIGGRSLFLSCTGSGSPTVLLEAGGPGRYSETWADVQPEIAKTTRVCSYDRAGLGQSDPAPEAERTTRESVNDLHALIEATDVGCPCVFVGESWGGVIVRLFAGQFPDNVAGLVYVDAIAPGFIARFLELVPEESPDRSGMLGAENPERVNQRAGFEQADQATLPPTVPAIVITHGLLLGFPQSFPVEQLEAAWREAQEAHARALHGRLIVAQTSGSDVVHEQPEIVVEAIGQVVNAVRDPATAVGALQVRVVDETGNALPGACFQIYDDAGDGARGAYRGAACDPEDGADDGTVTITNLTPGAYVMEDRKPPDGYLAAADTPVTVAGLATDVTVPHQSATSAAGTPTTTPPPAPTATSTPEPVARIVDLGTLGGASSDAYHANVDGDVVGVAATTDGERHAFLWRDGEMTDLDTLGGPGSSAYDVNDAGQIVGVAQLANEEWRGFLWEDGQMADLGTLGGNESRAFAINSEGQIVGTSRNGNGERRAFLWDDGTMVDLGTLGGPTAAAAAINDAGQIAGSSDTADGTRHVFLWQDGEMIDLGTLGGDQASVTDINDAGQVVGRSLAANGEEHAFLWSDDEMTDLGTLDAESSEAWSINEDGVVVGSFGHEESDGLAFRWRDGAMTDLHDELPDDAGWELRKARDIGNDGLIVGYGLFEGEAHGFLLTLPERDG
ncbi:MAG: alpha/beta fold hydrolase [Thermomicrobiales bacterium]